MKEFNKNWNKWVDKLNRVWEKRWKIVCHIGWTKNTKNSEERDGREG